MASMVITSEFSIGDTVYLKTDTEQRPYIVTGINIRPGHLTYDVKNNEVVLNPYDFEVSIVKNVSVI